MNTTHTPGHCPVRPAMRPVNPNFSSGPCSKRPGWTLAGLSDAFLGRSHRHKDGKAKLLEVIERSRKILEIPDDYKIGIVPASDTGAVEMAMWSMLGPRGVDMLAWESFGAGWVTDVKKQLGLDNVRILEAGYGSIPDLTQVNFDHDVVFTWNGTTSGAKVPNGDWITDNRQGLTVCDATSAAFAMELPWDKLDVTTYSWQKVLGGEGQHGMIVLSPRAIERLENFTPKRPLPKIFRLTKDGKLIEGIFRGETINTPSMLAVEDALDGLKWAENIGGLKILRSRADTNLSVMEKWVSESNSFAFLVDEKAIRSSTSVCLKIIAPWFVTLDNNEQSIAAKKLATVLDIEGVAYDIGSYRDAPSGLRIWTGATIEASDVEALMPWLDWALAKVQADYNVVTTMNTKKTTPGDV